MDLSDLFGPPELTKDQRKAAEELTARREKFEIEQREMVVANAWLLCTCRPWYDRDNPEPPQAGCVVHGALIMTRDGRVL